jgi:tetrahydromethanopterin S-methyltransferase subunit H
MDTVWDLSKSAINAILAACFGLVAYFGKSVLSRLSILEKDKLEQDKILLSMESKFDIRISVMESQVKDIQQDIKEIKDGINKLLHKLL